MADMRTIVSIFYNSMNPPFVRNMADCIRCNTSMTSALKTYRKHYGGTVKANRVLFDKVIQFAERIEEE